MSLEISIDMRQIDQYKAILKVAGEKLIPELDRAVATTVAEGKRYISEKTPAVTGNLRRGFQVVRLGPGISMIYNLVKYFPFIETGERLVRAHSNLRSRRTFGDRIVRRHAGPARMVLNSIQQIRERLALNVDVALTFLLRGRPL
ncbi:MAG: hypothetical protein WC529_08880 [Candidatus Margulisiibacteriota bacterium]